MIDGKRVLALVPARGGSKRLPGKNLRDLGGKPLIAWSVMAALQAPQVDVAVVSTDSPAIRDAGIAAGAQAPFLRPAVLARDQTSSEDTALHALDFMEREAGHAYDVLVLIEPTSPLRARGDVAGVLQLLSARWAEADAVVGVGPIALEQPAVAKTRDASGLLQPWLLSTGGSLGKASEKAYFPYGGIYACKAQVLREQRSFYPARTLGYEVERWQHYEVDELEDFLCIEAIFRHRGGTLL